MSFDGWENIGRVSLRGLAAYLALVVILRVSGKRTLSKLNAFDLVVTVALGSTLASILVSKEVGVAEGLAALMLLIASQYVISKASMRSASIRRIAKSAPTALLHSGHIDEGALRASRVTVSEVHQAVRASGHGDLAGIAAVVLEPDGSLSVIPSTDLGSGDALRDIGDATRRKPRP